MHQSCTTERVLCCHIFHQILPYTQYQTYRQPLPSQEFQSFHAVLNNVSCHIACLLKFKKSNVMRKAFICNREKSIVITEDSFSCIHLPTRRMACYIWNNRSCKMFVFHGFTKSNIIYAKPISEVFCLMVTCKTWLTNGISNFMIYGICILVT